MLFRLLIRRELEISNRQTQNGAEDQQYPVDDHVRGVVHDITVEKLRAVSKAIVAWPRTKQKGIEKDLPAERQWRNEENHQRGVDGIKTDGQTVNDLTVAGKRADGE